MGLHKKTGSLFTIVALAIVAGCSGGGSQVPSTTQGIYTGSHPISQSPQSLAHSNGVQSLTSTARLGPSRVIPAIQPVNATCPSTGLLMFVSDSGNNVLDVFSGSTMCHQITGLSEPQGVAYSQLLNRLYVANTSTSQVFIYEPPFKTIFKTLQDPGEFPVAVALCKGYTAVSNIVDTGGGPGTVSIYKGTGTTPVATLSDPNAAREYYATCDSSGNLFTTYSDTGGVGHVNEWIGGTGTPQEKNITLQFPGGIQWVNNVLMVGDQVALTIGSYKAPYNAPFRTINITKGGDPVSFAETPNDLFIQTADAAKTTSQRYHLTGGFVSKVPVGGTPIGVTFNQKP